MENTGTNIILNSENLAIGYSNKKQTTVIKSNLNLQVVKGSFTCILGKNGIGKSTLLRTLTKTQNKIDGKIELGGVDLEGIPASALAKSMSLVLTEKLPESNLTVYELIALGRQPYTNWVGKLTEIDKQKVNEALKYTNIEHLANKRHYQLSDGQLQRVLISRALSQDTDIIILDEPTAHLDIQHKIETFLLLQKLSKELNKTIIVSTHEINHAVEFSDNLWLMTDDNFYTGKPKELLEKKYIDKLFSSNLITFNQERKQFILKKD